MIDNTTGMRIEVLSDGNAGPYVVVPESQAHEVRDLLRINDISFTENAKSIRSGNGNDTIFGFGKGADVNIIQSVFDRTR